MKQYSDFSLLLFAYSFVSMSDFYNPDHIMTSYDAFHNVLSFNLEKRSTEYSQVTL